MTLDGSMSFTPGETPYGLKFLPGVERFDLAKFFRELIPRLHAARGRALRC